MIPRTIKKMMMKAKTIQKGILKLLSSVLTIFFLLWWSFGGLKDN